jgi:hypothetical protein
MHHPHIMILAVALFGKPPQSSEDFLLDDFSGELGYRPSGQHGGVSPIG